MKGRLSGAYRHILFDHVGCGSSDASAYSPRRYNSLFSYAADLLELLSAFEVRGCFVIAHSVSGMVSLLASLLEPGLIAGVIGISVSPRYLAEPGYPGAFTLQEIEDLFANAEGNYRQWISGFAPVVAQNPDKPQVAEHFAESLRHLRPDIALPILRMILVSDHRSELPKITVPTAFLQPLSDPAVPVEVGRYLHQNVQPSEYRELSATGHLPHLSNPEEVARIVGEELQSMTGGAG